MNDKIQNFLSLIVAILLSSACYSQNNTASGIKNITSIPGYEVVLPLNEYLTIRDTAPYPVLVQEKFKKINTRSFVNIMDYGALGNGLVPDDAAIATAFLACKEGGGVLFPKG